MSGRRPGRLWLLFYGRRRRGFPALLVTVLGLAVVLGLTFASRGGVAISYWIGIGFLLAIALLVLAALAVALLASLRRHGGR